MWVISRQAEGREGAEYAGGVVAPAQIMSDLCRWKRCVLGAFYIPFLTSRDLGFFYTMQITKNNRKRAYTKRMSSIYIMLIKLIIMLII